MNASCWGAISSTLIIPFRKPLNSNHISLDTFWYPGPPPIFPHHYCFRLQCHNFPKLPLSRISTSFTFLIIMICFPWSFFMSQCQFTRIEKHWLFLCLHFDIGIYWVWWTGFFSSLKYEVPKSQFRNLFHWVRVVKNFISKWTRILSFWFIHSSSETGKL